MMWRRPLVSRKACRRTAGRAASLGGLNRTLLVGRHDSSRCIHSTCGRHAPNVHALIAEKLKQYYKPSEDKPSRSYGQRLGEITSSPFPDVTPEGKPLRSHRSSPSERVDSTTERRAQADPTVDITTSSRKGNRPNTAAETLASEIEGPALTTDSSVDAGDLSSLSSARAKEETPTVMDIEASSALSPVRVDATAEATTSTLKSNRFAPSMEPSPSESQTLVSTISTTPSKSSSNTSSGGQKGSSISTESPLKPLSSLFETTGEKGSVTSSAAAQDGSKKSFEAAFASIRREDSGINTQLPTGAISSPAAGRDKAKGSSEKLSTNPKRDTFPETTPMSTGDMHSTASQSHRTEGSGRTSKSTRRDNPAIEASEQVFFDNSPQSQVKKKTRSAGQYEGKFLKTEEPLAAWTTIDTAESVSRMIESLDGTLKDRSSLYCTVFGSTSPFAVLIYAPHRHEIFAINLDKLDDAVFSIPGPKSSQSANTTLKDLLQSEDIKKVFWDVRKPLNTLYHHWNIDVSGIEDLQIMDATTRPKRQYHALDPAITDYFIATYQHVHHWYGLLKTVGHLQGPGGMGHGFRRFEHAANRRAWTHRLQIMPALHEFYSATPGGWRKRLSDMTRDRVNWVKDPATANQFLKLQNMDTPWSWYPEHSPRFSKAEVARTRRGNVKESTKTPSANTIDPGRHEAVSQSLVNLYRVSQGIGDPQARDFNLKAIEEVIEQTGYTIEDIKSRL